MTSRILLTAGFPLITQTAHANLVPTLTGITPAAPGVFQYNYEVRLLSGQQLNPSISPAYFTIYDIAGLVPGSASATGGISLSFVSSSFATGETPLYIAPPDGSLMNLTWTYTGAAVILGPQTVGTFSFRSTLGPYSTMGYFSALTTKNAPGLPTHNTPLSNVGRTQVPVAGLSDTQTPQFGRMTGGGSIITANVRITHGFELHCLGTATPNNLEINWNGNSFHLDTLSSVLCSLNPAIGAGQPNVFCLRWKWIEDCSWGRQERTV